MLKIMAVHVGITALQAIPCIYWYHYITAFFIIDRFFRCKSYVLFSVLFSCFVFI